MDTVGLARDLPILIHMNDGEEDKVGIAKQWHNRHFLCEPYRIRCFHSAKYDLMEELQRFGLSNICYVP